MYVEIKAAEGGDDAHNFAEQLTHAVVAHAQRMGGAAHIRGTHARAFTVLAQEAPALRCLAGIHRIQRVPANARGRRHSSTVLVAILEDPQAEIVTLEERDLFETTVRGSGPGGQHRNKTSTCVVLRHIPSGFEVRIDDSRSQYQNRRRARIILAERLTQQQDNGHHNERNQLRQEQFGQGVRSQRAWTHTAYRDITVRHSDGRRWPMGLFLRGQVDLD